MIERLELTLRSIFRNASPIFVYLKGRGGGGEGRDIVASYRFYLREVILIYMQNKMRLP